MWWSSRGSVVLWLFALGCSAKPDADPWDGRAQVLPCGFQPTRCLQAPGNQPAADQLSPSSSGFKRQIETDEYVGQAGSDCQLGYVFDLPPEKLRGTALQLSSLWSETNPTQGPERCAHYDATLHVFAVDPDAEDGYRLVDHRIFKAKPDEVSGLCHEEIRSGGPGEPDMPHNEYIWLTPRSYPFGLRMVSMATDACQPMPLAFGVSEGFAGPESVPELEPQAW